MVGTVVNVSELPAHTVVFGVLIVTDGVTTGLIVIVIELDVAGLPVTPLRLEVITQVTIVPVGIDDAGRVSVAEVAPGIGVLFPSHWYVGAVPPLVGVAVKVSVLLAQAGLLPDVIEMLTDATGATASVIVTADAS